MAGGAALALAAAAQQNIQFVRPRGPALEERLKAVTDDNAARAVEIRKQLSAAGCPEVEEQKVRGDREPNLICRIPGTNGHTIVVGRITTAKARDPWARPITGPAPRCSRPS